MEEGQVTGSGDAQTQRLIADAVARSGGRLALCWSPGKSELPLRMAQAGLMVVDLESDEPAAARFLQTVDDAGLRSSFQIFLKTPQELLAQSLDVFNVIALGGDDAAAVLPALAELSSRLLPSGVLIVHGVRPGARGDVQQRLKEAGLSDIRATVHYPQRQTLPGRLLAAVSRPAPSAVSLSGQKPRVGGSN